MSAKLTFDNELLAEIVASSHSYWMVARKIRPEKPRGIYKVIQRRIRDLGLDTSHFTGQGPKPTRWTNDQLREAIVNAASLAQVIRALGLVPAGGNYDQIQRRIAALGIDTSHFTGQGWNTGGKFVPAPAAPLAEVLVAGRWTGSYGLKLRLFHEGLKHPACEMCGWAERSFDGRIPVELDHINGDRHDNRLENLRILCPNCHSLQPTHRGLNQKRSKHRANRTSDVGSSSKKGAGRTRERNLSLSKMRSVRAQQGAYRRDSRIRSV